MDNESINVLFICSMNQWRSPTAERVYVNDDSIQARSRGTSSKARRTMTASDLKWADLICVMEDKHKQQLKSRFPNETAHSNIHVLHIPDEYQFMDPELIACIRESVDFILSSK